MNRMTRRGFIVGGIAALIALPALVSSGMAGYLRGVLARHFGDHVLAIEGVNAFVEAYAAQAGADNRLKKLASEIYFRYGGPNLVPYAGLDKFSDKFLTAFLTRSNIIAIEQGRADAFEFSEVNPYEPACGLYLSALAEDA